MYMYCSYIKKKTNMLVVSAAWTIFSFLLSYRAIQIFNSGSSICCWYPKCLLHKIFIQNYELKYDFYDSAVLKEFFENFCRYSIKCLKAKVSDDF